MGEARGRAAVNDAAGFEHVAEIGGLERGAGILLDQENRDAKLAQADDNVKNLAHDPRVIASYLGGKVE